MRQRCVVLVLLTVAGTISTAFPASATTRGTVGTVTPDNRHFEYTSPSPLVGVYPYGEAPAEPFANFRPTVCRTVTYCDTVEFEVKYPANLLRERLFGITISLTWDNAYHEQQNPAGNDVDLFLWGSDDPTSGAPASKCTAPSDVDCNNIHPEVVTMTEPPDTTLEDADPPTMLLTVVSEKGVNTGYTITVDWFFFEIEAPPRFSPPDRETSTTPFPDRVAGPFDFEVTDQADEPATPTATPRKILIPGPDGKMHEVELPLYAAGQRLPTSAERNTATPWIVAGIAGAIVLAVLAFMLVRRNRQLMEEV